MKMIKLLSKILLATLQAKQTEASIWSQCCKNFFVKSRFPPKLKQQEQVGHFKSNEKTKIKQKEAEMDP